MARIAPARSPAASLLLRLPVPRLSCAVAPPPSRPSPFLGSVGRVGWRGVALAVLRVGAWSLRFWGGSGLGWCGVRGPGVRRLLLLAVSAVLTSSNSDQIRSPSVGGSAGRTSGLSIASAPKRSSIGGRTGCGSLLRSLVRFHPEAGVDWGAHSRRNPAGRILLQRLETTLHARLVTHRVH